MGNAGARSKPDRQIHHRPLFTETEDARDPVPTGEHPLLDRSLSGVAPGTEIFKAANIP
jgi:hypothetical protein